MSSLQIGIVGLPNVGKSTLFNVLTKNRVLAANYPFATIEPNVGVIEVPDERLERLARISKSVEVIPASVTFVDIAGLVRGASEGAGLGNKFLSHIRECAAIVQVVRAFEDDGVVHVEGKVDPADDIETIRTELCLADLKTVEKRLDTLEKELKTNPKAIALINELVKIKEILDNGKLVSRHFDEVPDVVRDLQLLTAKPFIYVFNLSENELGDVTKKKQLSYLVGGPSAVFLSARIEAELMDLPDDEKGELLQSLGQKQSGLENLIRTGYQTLNLQTFFTSGPKESRAWTIKVGSTAPAAAGVIHTDFEKGFIRAEVASYEDFAATGGWAGAKEAGQVRLEGKEYIVRDGDVIVFRFNV